MFTYCYYMQTLQKLVPFVSNSSVMYNKMYHKQEKSYFKHKHPMNVFIIGLFNAMFDSSDCFMLNYRTGSK